MRVASLRITPNPAPKGSEVTVSLFNEFQEELLLELCDYRGSVVNALGSSNDRVVIKHLETRGIKPGTYILRISGKRIRINHKFQINF